MSVGRTTTALGAFYRRLAASMPESGLHLTAVMPQARDQAVAYLASLEVDVRDVRQGSFGDLKVHGRDGFEFYTDKKVTITRWL